MKVFYLGILFLLLSLSTKAQDAPRIDEFEWLRMLIDSIKEETDLCTNCLTPPEVRSYITPAGVQRFRLRYQCDAQTSTTKLYATSGEIVGVCIIDTINRNCEFDADFTGYTFGREITTIWTCDDGFDCNSAPREVIFPPYEITISGNPCSVGERIMSSSTPFEAYLWTDPLGGQGTDSQSVATETGDYQLIVTDANGCMDTTNFFVGTNEDIVPQILGQTTLCDDEGVHLSVSGFESVLWSNGETEPSTVIRQPGTVSAIVQYSSGCIDTAHITIIDARSHSITIQLSNNEIYEGQTIEAAFIPNGLDHEDLVEINWMINDQVIGNSELMTFMIDQRVTVVVEVLTSGGCILRDELLINPLPVNRDIYFSSAFNPNSTSGNDRFFPQSILGTIEVRDLFIYDRWGSLVYANAFPLLNDQDNGWDGTMSGEILPPGIYIYRTDVHYADGST